MLSTLYQRQTFPPSQTPLRGGIRSKRTPRIVNGSGLGLRRRRLVGLVLSLLAALLVAAYPFFPRAPLLRTYVSPPLDAERTRVSVRYPAGWIIKRVTLSTAGNPASVSITIGPPAWPPWMPDWLTRWRVEPMAYLDLTAGHVPRREATTLLDEAVLKGIGPSGLRFWRAAHERLESGWSLYLTYSRTDQVAFDRTQLAIRDSLLVVPGKKGGTP